MALDENAYLPTPENYATPNQLKAARDYAKALLYGYQEKGTGQQQIVNHWTQGLSNMANALMGGYGLHQAWKQETGTDRAGSRAMPARQEAGMPTGFTSNADGGAPTGMPPVRAMAPVAGVGGGMGRDYKPGVEPDDSPLYEGNEPPQEASTPPPIPRPRPDMAPASVSDRFGPFSGAGPQTGMPPGALPFDAMASANANAGMPPANGLDAITMALKGGAPRAPFGAPVGQAPDTTYVDPRTIPKRPQINRQQFEAIMSNQLASPEMKKMAMEAYYEQNQPVQVEYPGGKVIIGPDGAQRHVPEIKDRTLELPGGFKIPQPGMILPPGSNNNFTYQKVPSVGGGAPATGPLLGGPPPGPNIKDLMKYAPDDTDLPALGVAPPGFPTDPSASADSEAGGKGVKTAQLDPDTMGLYNWARKSQLDYEKQHEFNKKDIDSYDKDYNLWATVGQKAAAGMPQLEMMKNVVSDPRFYSGIGGEGIVMPFKQLQAQFGNDPEAASRMEMFRKGISGQIVEDMKIMLQGLGQVRVAEIDLLAKSSASLNQTRAGNEAVLELAIRSHKQINALSKAANLYRQGYSMDKDGNFVFTGNTPTKAGQDALLKRVSEENPILTPAERRNYEKLFSNYDQKKYLETKKALEGSINSKPGETSTSPAAPKTEMPPPPPGFRMQ